MDEKLARYYELREMILAYNYAVYMINWDSETEAPQNVFIDRGRYLGVLSKQKYLIMTSSEFEDLLTHFSSYENELQFETIRIKEENDKLKKIPMEEYVKYNELLGSSANIWAEAKNKKDFSLFKPVLKEIVSYNKKFVTYLKTDKLEGYDCLLNEFEKDMTVKDYDLFFDLLKKELVPFVKQILSKKLTYNDTFLKNTFPKEKQKEVVNYLAKVMEFDFNSGMIKESEHPFTSGFGSKDVRYTVHYYDKMFTSSIFSALHEGGHAKYEQQIAPKYDNTFLSGGTSMAMHESQSRFYENIIGRSKTFWENHFPMLKKIYLHELENITLDDFYKHINKVENTYIRVEADELTYPLHIMLRYDLEKELFNDNLSVDDLPKRWNELVKMYLGIDVTDDSIGVLQDVHWSNGYFGYFPTYALGSAYAAQILHEMSKSFNPFDNLNTTKEINQWLALNIHQYGASIHAKDLLKKATNETFNPNYYVDYLKTKYAKIYGIIEK